MTLNNKPIKILCLKGGGVRGCATAEFLKNLEGKDDISIYKDFDMVSGTSTGAMIGGGLFSGVVNAQELADDMYSLENCRKIFTPTYTSYLPLVHRFWSHYYGEGKREILDTTFKDVKLNGLDPDRIFMSVTYNYTRNAPALWSNQSGKSCLLADVLDGSSAAPDYFPSVQINFESSSSRGEGVKHPQNHKSLFCESTHGHHRNLYSEESAQSGDWHVDGGALCNWPMVESIGLARKKWGRDREIKLFCLGTGFSWKDVDSHELLNPRGWGGYEYLGHGLLSDMIDAESRLDLENARNLLNGNEGDGENVFVLDGPLPKGVPSDMDITREKHISALKKLGTSWYEKNRERVLEFLKSE